MLINQTRGPGHFALAIATSLVALTGTAWTGAARAADRLDYGGKMSLTVVHQEAKPLDDKGHVATATVYKGTNSSTGRIAYMDGSDVFISDVADLAQGNGSALGSGMHIKDGVAKGWTVVDAIKTTIVDGKPMTTIDGKVSNASDAPLKDISVHCLFTSQTTMECDWTGRAMKDAKR